VPPYFRKGCQPAPRTRAPPSPNNPGVKTRTRETYDERLTRVLVHIERNLAADITVESAARLAHFSPFHFHRIFHAMTGETLADYIRRLRLEAAAMRLGTTSTPAGEIAREVGFQSDESFSRAFRQRFGVPPGRYRKGHHGHRPAPSRRDSAPPPEVRLERLEPLRVAFVRHVGPYTRVGLAWFRLMWWASRSGLTRGHVRCLGITHDDPGVTEPARLRYDACLVVMAGVQPVGHIGIQEIAGGEYAVTTHCGRFEDIGRAYDALFGHWLPASGREPRALPCLNETINWAPWRKPGALITHVYLPLEE
jgi:AraC family transcriptional regulator